MEAIKDKWEESYKREENFIFYPKEEVVKFMNRFVRKRSGVNEFKDVMDFSGGVKALDFGCGIGRHAILMREFGIDAYGVDISSTAIDVAKDLSETFGFPEMKENFSTSDGSTLAFEDKFFNVTIAESVLDSLGHELAKVNLKEIARVTKDIIFISLISGDDSKHHREFADEIVVQDKHEEGTIQNYFNWSKIEELVQEIDFDIVWNRLIQEESLTSQYRGSRYYIVLKKKG